MISYLIQVTICFGLFYLLYYFLLKGDKFFNLQRAYLLITLILSATIPLIELGSYQPVIAQQIPIVADAFAYIQMPQQTNTIDQQLGWSDYLFIGYLIIAGLCLFKFLFTVRSLVRVIRKGEKEISGRYTMLYTDKQILIASFFKYIFIEKSLRLEKESLDYMLIHEKKHIRDFHFIDLIILEIVKILFWFNPVVYLYSYSLKSVHEYICDQEVVRYTTPENYEKLLIKSFFKQVGMPLLSQFSETSIKSRLTMIKKQNSVWFKKLKFLAIIPITFLLVYACNQEEFNEIVSNSESEVVTTSQIFSGKVTDESGQPLPGVNIILEGTKVGTISDLSGNYKLDNSSTGAQKVTFSFIGLESVTIDIESKSVIDVSLIEDGSDLGDEKDDISLTFEKNRKVKGRILLEDGKPASGVTVVLLGADIGAITSSEGNYEIAVPDDNGFLMYSFNGMKSQFLEVGQKAVIDVVMEEKEVEVSSNN